MRSEQILTGASLSRRIKPSAVALAVAACFSAGAALANPTNPTVVHGTATFDQVGNILNITNSANAIINWGSFSISVGELTRFIQPSALSAVLNRVTGQDPSA
ncbi:MAG: hemagglutinin, partial [Burkholderiales bacterium]|nr:hemagglutinin [Burkholderiales bacterium]